MATERKLTGDGSKIVDSIDDRLGRSPDKDDMEHVADALQDAGLQCLSAGNTTRFVFALPENLVEGGGVLKIPRKETDFYQEYPFPHLGVDQNIRAIYAAEYLEREGITPPVIDYSETGVWVVFPLVSHIKNHHRETVEKKSQRIQQRDDIRCVTSGEFSGVMDIEKLENWGVYNGNVVLRDLGCLMVEQAEAPDLDIPEDPVWNSAFESDEDGAGT